MLPIQEVQTCLRCIHATETGQQSCDNLLDDQDLNDPAALELENGLNYNIPLRDRANITPQQRNTHLMNNMSSKNTKASLKIATLNIRDFCYAGAARNEYK